MRIVQKGNSEGTQILVVEDHKPMSRAIKGILESEGYTVSTAADGVEALEIMGELVPDLILADIMMPRMDGYVLYDRVRARPERVQIPFVFLTAKSEREDKLKGKQLGAEDYITKPFDAEELIISVRSCLARAQAIDRANKAEFKLLKEQITTILAHELRTPLTHVKGYTDLALEDVSSLTPGEFEEFLKGIKAGTDRLNRLVEELLLLAQIDSGITQNEFEARVCEHDNLNEIVERTARQFSARARQHNVSIEVSTDSAVPRVRLWEPLFVDALGRLVENGMKFSREGGKRVRIETMVAENGVMVIVADHGVGIRADQQGHLFERFRQINRDQMEQQGAGLGLAIAQELIGLHDGEIVVESSPGEGSTFTIVLPPASGSR